MSSSFITMIETLYCVCFTYYLYSVYTYWLETVE